MNLFHPDFEIILLYFSANSRKFWISVGRELEPDDFASPLAKLILGAVRLITVAGQHPDSATIVLQRLQSKVAEGKLTEQSVTDVQTLLSEVATFDRLPEVDAVIQELVPVMQHKIQTKAVMAAADAVAKRGDMEAPLALFEHAKRLGKTETRESVDLGVHSFAYIRDQQVIQRMPTGIFPLDVELAGGLNRKGLGVFVATSGGGKSMALIHGLCQAMRDQLHVALVTLELSVQMQKARILANLTGVDITLIECNEKENIRAQAKFEKLQGRLGTCTIVEFDPHISTVSDISRWLDDYEQAAGRRIDALYVDYADKLTHPGIREDNEYLKMRFVYEALRRDIAVKRDIWVWTASQTNRSKTEGKRIDMANIADSKHKINISDLVVSLNFDDETQMVTYFVMKNRTGRARFEVGPLPTDYAKARAMPINER